MAQTPVTELTEPAYAAPAAPLTFTHARARDVAVVHDVMVRAAADALPGHFVVTDLETLTAQMASGFTVMAYLGSSLAGLLHVHFPTDLGSYAARVGDPFPCRVVAHMDTVAVLPAFRGRGLMRLLLDDAEAHLSRVVPERAAWYATVHPDNEASRRSFERGGYEPVAQVTNQAGAPRLVVRKVAT
jgi:ribosomal protein S18 acetylase RimI-like enzyme